MKGVIKILICLVILSSTVNALIHKRNRRSDELSGEFDSLTLSNFYEAESKTLEKITIQQTRYFTKLYEHVFSSNSKLNNNPLSGNDMCVEKLKNQMVEGLIYGMNKNNECLEKEKTSIGNSLYSKIWSSETQSIFINCFNRVLSYSKIKNCIDTYPRDEIISQTYNDIIDSLKKNNESAMINLNNCVENTAVEINNTINDALFKITLCPKQKIISYDPNSEEPNSYITLEALKEKRDLADLHDIWKSKIPKLRSTKYDTTNKITTKAISNFREIVHAMESDGKNGTCCLEKSEKKINNANENIVNELDECFKNASLHFDDFINMQLLNDENLKSSFKNCYENDPTIESILKCIDNTDKTEEQKQLYNNTQNTMEEKNNELKLSMHKCLENKLKIFQKLVISEYVGFNKCILSQTSDKCEDSSQ
ncbi:hypothetical protein HCN44_009615 [Aphidius gifuensis]|uniref:Odorant-binding protein n=1 Tax=Aphidius gifuensis TaxID=684658 RepID=A0A834Y5F6_APHGI|nr:hypothetical protein HCN44_009615 [Aphidius gifuensis]